MKKRNLFSILICLLTSLSTFLFTGCFHKDVMNDRADDISQSFVYTGKGGPYIITQELIFQATSKSSGGGVTNISGYNECRLTSYDMATGAMLGRVELGEEIDEACKIIGVVNDQVWCYSIDPELGLHSRDPKTLEVQKKEKDLSGLSGVQLARPEWSRISDYYALETGNHKIMITDMQGVHYYFDVTANKTEQTENDMPEVEWSPEYLENTAYFAEDSFVAFNGNDDRRKLMWKYEDTTADLPFLKPSFLVDLNEERALKRRQEKISMATAYRDKLKAQLDSLIAVHPVFKDKNPSWSDMTADERDRSSDVYHLYSDIEDAERDLNDLTDEFDDNYDYALTDKRYSCLIYSAHTVSDTSRAILTCVDSKAKKFTERWHLDLSSFYFDPDKAEGAGVFDEGDPEFRYRWADIYDGKFVMIAQLQMVCVDMATGKKLWEIPL